MNKHFIYEKCYKNIELKYILMLNKTKTFQNDLKTIYKGDLYTEI